MRHAGLGFCAQDEWMKLDFHRFSGRVKGTHEAGLGLALKLPLLLHAG